MPYFELSKDELTFPPAYFADNEGFVAVGGDMAPERLLLAYNSGIFFWHHPFKHIKWWSPDPRIVLLLNDVEFPENRLNLLKEYFSVTFNTEFEKTLRLCQEIYNVKERMNNEWLSERSFRTFMTLHQQGYAKSVEIWKENELIGGLFGVSIGKLFFNEYLFSRVRDANEFAVLSLIKKLKDENFKLIDMQKPTGVFDGLPYDEVSRIEYVGICKTNAENYGNNILN
ncbi:MAG: leucyl/phenylalanyl-tRNA--protein transferase [Maribacter sp.]|nr:leucyl/phenylalanyl-tRNA--protein transferase [Maribacter sp.]